MTSPNSVANRRAVREGSGAPAGDGRMNDPASIPVCGDGSDFHNHPPRRWISHMAARVRADRDEIFQVHTRPYLLGRHNALARRGVYLSVVDRDKFRREAQAVYLAVLPDAENCLLTWVWPRWIALDDIASARARFTWLEVELAKSELPTLIIRGREDEVFDAATLVERFKRLMPYAEGPHMLTGRHFLQGPQPDAPRSTP